MSKENMQVATGAIVQVLPIIIILIIGIIIFKKFKGIFNFGEPDKEEIKRQEDEVKGITLDTKKMSYGNSEYLSMANKLEQALQGWGTDEDSIIEVLKRMKNQTDWNATIKTFGTRQGENLLGWIRSDVDKSNTFGQDQNSMNKILISKGINQNLI